MRPHRHPSVVEVWAHRSSGGYDFSSGYLIASNLILTAGHGVFPPAGVTHDRIEVQLHTSSTRRQCTIVWQRCDDRIDAALLEIVDTDLAATTSVPAPRWGRFTGSDPWVEAAFVGFPEGMASHGRPAPDQVRGHINPGTITGQGWYTFMVGDGRPVHSPMWQGISGSAVFAETLLVGVVAERLKNWEGQLAVVPVETLMQEPEFYELVTRHTHATPFVESVELHPLFPKPSPGMLQSPSWLLRPDVDVVDFRGREELLARTRTWCEEESSDAFGIRLVVGPAGQGKSRFARQLIDQMRRRDWVAGQLAKPPAVEKLLQLSATALPVLLVIDYAEGQQDVIRELVDACLGRRSAAQIRLLLLARSKGEWWETLSEARAEIRWELSSAGRDVEQLPPLYSLPDARPRDFRDAATGLARYLGALPGYEEVKTWEDIARTLPIPDLSHDRYANPLTMHMEALTHLLQAGPLSVRTEPSSPVEDVLLDHEAWYWRTSSKSHRLEFSRDTYREAVAAVVLVPVVSRDQAQQILGVVPALADQSVNEQRATAAWLRDLYPPGQDTYWGSLQPDRLAEYLVADVAAKSADFLSEVLSEAGRLSAEAVAHAITVVARAAVHQKHLAKPLTELIVAQPDAFAVAAIVAATQAEQPEPLLAAIDEIGSQLDSFNLEQLQALLSVIPAQSHRLARVAVSLSAAVRERLAAAASVDPGVRPLLADALRAHASRLSTAQRKALAIDAASQAVELHRLLARSGDDTQNAHLVNALNQLSTYRHRMRDYDGAVSIAQEAVETAEILVERNPHEYIPLLLRSRGGLSKPLTYLGRAEEARRVVQQGIDRVRDIGAGQPEQYREEIAQSLLHQSRVLNASRLHSETEPLVSEAVTLLREIASTEPTAHRRHQLAMALRYQSISRSNLMHFPEALAAAAESMEILSQLAATQPDPYLAEKALLLRDVGNIHDRLGQTEEAFKRFTEGVEAYGLLAAGNSALYLARFAKASQDLALRCVKAHHGALGVTAARDAVAAHRVLARTGEPEYRAALAESLKMLSRQPDLDSEEAVKAAESAVGIYAELAVGSPDEYQRHVAYSSADLAYLLARVGRQQASAEALESSLMILKERAESEPDLSFAPYQYMAFNVAGKLLGGGDEAAGISHLEDLVDFCRRNLQISGIKQRRTYAICLVGVANQMLGSDRISRAKSVLDMVDAVHDQLFGSTSHVASKQVIQYGQALAQALRGLHQAGDRERVARILPDLLDLVKALQVTDPRDPLPRANLFYDLAHMFEDFEEYGHSATMAAGAALSWSILTKTAPAKHVGGYANSLGYLALCYIRCGNRTAAFLALNLSVRCWYRLESPTEAQRDQFGRFLVRLSEQVTEVGQSSLGAAVADRAAKLSPPPH